MTTPTLFPLHSQKSYNNIQDNPIGVNTYTLTSALYMALHITVYMYIALRTLQLTSAQKPHPLDSLRTLVEANTQTNSISANTYTHPLPSCSWYYKHVHGTGMLQCTLCTNNHTFLVTSAYPEKP